MAAGLLGGALCVLPLPWRLRACGALLMLPLLAPPVARPPPGRFDVVAVDIGQGNAVIVRTARHLLLYDTGPAYTPEADAGSRVLVPLLRARGDAAIDALVVSHRDLDHAGGAAALLAALPVRRLVASLEPGHALRADAEARGIRFDPCAAGQRWVWDGVAFAFLHPPEGTDVGFGTRPNAVSCVLHVRAADGGGAGVLLAGDIEAAQEAALLQRTAPEALRADVLLVPHHGSRTSSSAGFIDAVAPRVALVQAGYRNRFGHPAPDVVARYAARGAAVVRSDRCGAWTRPAGAAPSEGSCQRETARRYWHHRFDDPSASGRPR
jgi:competence protein ComEC